MAIGCVSEGNAGRNIEIVDGYRSIISNNIVKNGSSHGIYTEAKYSIISDNVISNPGKDGIVNYASDCAIKGNYINLDATDNGIFVQMNRSGVIISDNRIEGGANGVYIESAGSGGNHSITNNTIMNSASNSIFVGNNNNHIFGNFVNKTIANNGSGNIIKHNKGYATESSGASTGTGSQQSIPHGLAKTPLVVMLSNKDDGANPFQSALADSTNIYITAIAGKGYVWKAEV